VSELAGGFDTGMTRLRRSRAPRAASAGTPTRPGDREIQEFVDHEYGQVVATVQLVCGSAAAAEDAVQEALARAWEQYLRGTQIDRLGAWVTTVSLNLVRSQLRRRRVERAARARLIGARQTTDEPGMSAVAHAVREALAGLPRRQREVTVLRYYAGLDVAEIAGVLGISDGTVKAMLFRARQSLAAVLGDDDPDDGGDAR
jgi:RNA polymerase sigma factor (sigma-70 family)